MLASVQKIDSLSDICNADNIQTAKVLGWEVVVKKGEFAVGDLCIFVEIDSLIPNREWSSFLFKGSHEQDDYFRLRTIKLRGQISQGLVLPISIVSKSSSQSEISIGEDVTGDLEIKKYNKPVTYGNVHGVVVKTGAFPAFLRKTDEIRIQSKPELLKEVRGKPYYITQKMDGTSSTFYRWNGEFGVCSRNMQILNPLEPKGLLQYVKRIVRKIFGVTKKEVPNTDIYWRMATKYHIKNWLPEGYAIQGEICGPGIQQNKMGLDDLELFIFNVWNITEQRYEDPFKFISDAVYNNRHSMEIVETVQLVPVLERGNSFGAGYENGGTLEELLESAKGNYSNGTPQEGIVIRSDDQTTSFKVINNDFLLHYAE